MSINDITGDKIATDVPSEAYRSNYDRIFGKKPIIPQTLADVVEQDKDKDDREIAANLSGN